MYRQTFHGLVPNLNEVARKNSFCTILQLITIFIQRYGRISYSDSCTLQRTVVIVRLEPTCDSSETPRRFRGFTMIVSKDLCGARPSSKTAFGRNVIMKETLAAIKSSSPNDFQGLRNIWSVSVLVNERNNSRILRTLNECRCVERLHSPEPIFVAKFSRNRELGTRIYASAARSDGEESCVISKCNNRGQSIVQ